MKKKALISSILSIVLCISLIAGSTFALFTDTAENNIAITAGRVDINATIEDLTLYSAIPPTNEVAPVGTTVDENGKEYMVIEKMGTFENGGTATVEGNSLKLVNITPGDKVKFNLSSTNNSNVNIQYRMKLECTKGLDLMSALVVTLTMDGEETKTYESLVSYTSKWFSVGGNTDIKDTVVEIEFPMAAGNEYMGEEGGEETAIRIIVEAVQGNAIVEGDEYRWPCRQYRRGCKNR